ncbi:MULTISPECIES: NAD(P)-dependent oxidoreductase [unclassified Sphingomonas]|uniref:NAD(P)-dependent oxidoreductase n=1 Tax=unclassified Sphingomonas TaxID=196159 RepID=UPI00092A3A0E|nr:MULTISPECIES: NAD(P)-dependent oxidoreductase [unclassified Sphingomonas]MBN8849146.1 NAD(P)-dependent oxidoreductase [Sphingomonas sp.]OJV31091.1 MAG: NAD(P)-dependent oxidoreductase [Sphingomonas sp. 67-36]
MIFVFGLGYAACAIVDASGWPVLGTTRDGRDGTIAFDDEEAVRAGLAAATHVLSSVPPDAAGGDPVLARYGDLIGRRWLGYLSSTGVYGDTGGAWVDESAPTGGGRRGARAAADAAWLARAARVFRLPGIYGPGRSPLDRLRAGTAHRVEAAGQVFSRIHVADIARGVVAGFDAPAGAYNLADDLPAGQNEVIDYAAALLGLAPPPLVALDTLSPAARGFYAENRRIANDKAKRVLGWTPLYPDYRAGLRAVSAITSPTPASAAPPIASGDQR